MLLICDPETSRSLIRKRRALGLDGFDEVWDGVYVMSPIADDEHQEVSGNLVAVMVAVIAWCGLGKVRPGVNISDRRKGWKRNYRVPDVVVFLKGSRARNCSTFWFGGPDFAAEIISKGDRSRQKLDFYAKVGTRELLIVDRFPCALELYAAKNRKMKLVGSSTLEKPELLRSTVLPLTFRLVAGEERPAIEVTHPGEKKTWLA